LLLAPLQKELGASDIATKKEVCRMAWQFVKQPNGLFARFSGIVDSFTHVNLSEAQAIDLCEEDHGMSLSSAQLKVLSAVDDIKPWTKEKGSGHDRWESAIEMIRLVSGEDALQELMKVIATGLQAEV
jgi:hypothetical protein